MQEEHRHLYKAISALEIIKWKKAWWTERTTYTGLFEMIVGVLTTAISFARCNPMWFLSMGLRQRSGLCSSSSRKYPGTEGTNQNSHWNHHGWHTTNSLERTQLSCWCLYNHKGCTYRAPVRYVTKTWSVVLLSKYIYIYIILSQAYCVWQFVKTLTVISNNPVYMMEKTREWRFTVGTSSVNGYLTEETNRNYNIKVDAF